MQMHGARRTVVRGPVSFGSHTHDTGSQGRAAWPNDARRGRDIPCGFEVVSRVGATVLASVRIVLCSRGYLTVLYLLTVHTVEVTELRTYRLSSNVAAHRTILDTLMKRAVRLHPPHEALELGGARGDPVSLELLFDVGIERQSHLI